MVLRVIWYKLSNKSSLIKKKKKKKKKKYSLAAQCSLSAQQNHPAFGQHPAGHSVPGQSCLTSCKCFFGAAIPINFSAMLIFLQYSSLAAQYSSPGQQNHPAFGQHPPGHSVPGQSCLTSSFFIGGQSASVAAQKYPLSQ